MNNVRSLAIIMDGNGRWANSNKLERTMGHKKGVEVVRDISIVAAKSGIEVLTLFTFSTQNWKRSEKEVSFIMSLPALFFKKYFDDIMANNIKIEFIGFLEQIPSKTLNVLNDAKQKTANNTGMLLVIAINYGGQEEIARAMVNYCDDVINGKRSNNLVCEEINQYLMCPDIYPLDLIIRTSGEYRISNFLLFQLAYAELIFIDKPWPLFTGNDLLECINIYNNRQRRFGGY